MDDASRNRILVLDGDLPPALAIARTLARRGLRVEIASNEPRPLGGFSRYVAATHRYPNPLVRSADFIRWISAQLEDPRLILVIPVTERTLTPLHANRQCLDTSRIAMAPEDALRIALNKGETVALAARLGIPVPLSRAVHTPNDIDAAAAGLEFPVVIKPASSIGVGQHGQVALTVQYATDRAELHHRVRHILHHGRALIQEYFAGVGVGIELIAEHGRILYAFQHQRLHEYPLTGGGSSLRCSTAVDPHLLEVAAQLMAALHWHGVAMVEFKHRPATGELRLMEINGRFWGSLPLATAAGADFPGMLYELLVEGRVKDRPPARNGVICRNLTRDLKWYECVLRRDAPEPFVRYPSRRQVLADTALLFSPRHHFDVQSWRDPLPGLVEIGRLIQTQARRGGDYLSAQHLRRRQAAAWRKGRISRRLRKASHVLFLCYGNINRSAIAEVLARAHFPPRLTICSAGFHPQAGRRADPVMASVAQQQGYDLSASRSQCLTPAMAAAADLIFVMEVEHLRRIRRELPAASAKTFLLAGAAEPQRACRDIADPFGHSHATYEGCFAMIAACIGAMASLSTHGEGRHEIAPIALGSGLMRATGQTDRPPRGSPSPRSWLDRLVHPRSQLANSTHPRNARPSGMTYQESPILLVCRGRRLVGLVTTPCEGERHAEVGLLILVGGSQYRAGSHRQFTLLARALATQGIVSLRFDYRGMGDSEGETRDFTAVDADIAAALDSLFARAPKLRSVVLWGLCDAASAALMYAPADPRVSGLVLLNPWAPHEQSRARARLKHYYGPKLLQWSLWTKMLAGKLRLHPSVRELLHALRLACNLPAISSRLLGDDESESARARLDVAGSDPDEHGEARDRMLRALGTFNGDILFILAANDLTGREFLALVDYEAEWRRVSQRADITWELVQGASHTFASAEWRGQVERSTARFVLRTASSPTP
ncbi:hydrolase, exosortase system type 1 associated [Thiorhodococcus drewsii AZ1]|uniref:protein-tyrosine-phosphatase n=1 Tax=Thiorhodococcus drewsii AZ1 TaxID=765913 RepID=G2E889_9GAMM|nr:hydrolase 1, exosortase A system-associated [Thiorhodococcus drewsii]EGV27682.1 hydrolase, exosortase system type 1 associated [Thiorhodococcus drewsii AZ1]